jgi:hypothetical protein
MTKPESPAQISDERCKHCAESIYRFMGESAKPPRWAHNKNSSIWCDRGCKTYAEPVDPIPSPKCGLCMEAEDAHEIDFSGGRYCRNRPKFTPIPSPIEAAKEETSGVPRPRLDFWGWWNRDGKFYDPDTEDVPWFDKRKFLAERAFDAGVAQSSNYTANREVFPRQVSFANGRVVSVRWDNGEAFLEVESRQQILVTVAAEPVEAVSRDDTNDPIGEIRNAEPGPRIHMKHEGFAKMPVESVSTTPHDSGIPEHLRFLNFKGEQRTPLPQQDGIALIEQERLRQIEEEHWLPEWDDKHTSGQLADAASCYAKIAAMMAYPAPIPLDPPSSWPWAVEWWRPSSDPKRNLAKAGALIAAEIDRIQRSGK